MSDLVFYTNPLSRGAIVHWMLEELGEPYDTVWLEYDTDMKAPEFLAINPLGKVPTVTYKGAVVTEGAAICTYLAAIFPEKKLIPAPDDPRLADFYRWMFFMAGPFEMAWTVKSMGWPVSAENSRSLGFGTIDGVLATALSAVSKGSYICAEQFTAADVIVGSFLDFSIQFGIFENDTTVEEYVARLKSRPAYKRSDQICKERIEQPKKD
ncbi:MAG: glutathione S-transferase family protein [Proteobacteria bacterium]|nr:glutathione S-transferase family protein [Pseudomonadota bacterium]